MLILRLGGIPTAQLFQLKAQILAYKYLSRNLPLPPKLLSTIKNFSVKALQQQHTLLQQKQLQQKQQQLAQQQQQHVGQMGQTIQMNQGKLHHYFYE